jgi:hypothetical protein
MTFSTERFNAEIEKYVTSKWDLFRENKAIHY